MPKRNIEKRPKHLREALGLEEAPPLSRGCDETVPKLMPKLFRGELSNFLQQRERERGVCDSRVPSKIIEALAAELGKNTSHL